MNKKTPIRMGGDESLNPDDYEVIGEGSYGCVHSPPLECASRTQKKKNKKDKKKLSKIILTKKARVELKEYTLIDKADHKHTFHLQKPSECKVRKTAKNMRAISKCPKIMSNFSELDDYSLLIMNDGGLDIEKFVDLVETWPKTTWPKTTWPKTTWPKTNMYREKMHDFWREFERMVKAVEHLVKNGIVHHDIKILNIVYNTDTQRTNLIDFGLADKIENKIRDSKKSKNWLGNHYHWSYPFEAVLWNRDKYMAFVKLSLEDKTRAFEQIVSEIQGTENTNIHQEFRTFFSDVLPRDEVSSPLYQKMTHRYFTDNRSFLCEKINADNYTEFLRKSIETIDVFGLGMVMAYVLKRTRHFVSAEFEKEMIEYIYGLLTPDVFARSDAHTAVVKYHEILDKL
jgi:serine/threonine protein kinase